MHPTSLNKMRAFAEEYLRDFRGHRLVILDIGSQAVGNMPTYRQFFNNPNWQYYRLDLTEGENVDIAVKDPYSWTEIADNFADVVISGQAFEHIEFPWLTIKEIFRVLKPGGLCCLIAPSAGPEHKHPYDCWRIYPDGMRALAKWAGFEIVEVFTDWGLGEWQDTIGIFQKPTEDGANNAPFGKVESKNIAEGVYLQAIKEPNIYKGPQYYARAYKTLKDKKDYKSAYLYLTAGLNVYPHNIYLRQRIVELCLETKEPEKAVEHVLYLLKAKPINKDSIALVSWIFDITKENDKALILQSLPSTEHELTQMAQFSELAGGFELASACWGKIVEINPQNLNAKLMHAYCVRATGNVELSDRLFDEALEFQLKNNILNRTTIIQRLIDRFGFKNYLEIGVERGLNFLQIRCPVKYAVDHVCKVPNLDRYERFFYKMTSDEFFANPPREIVDGGLDIVFIDGLHTYEQSLRDVENALRFLKPEGFIVMHDCLPDSPATAAPTLEEARKHPQFKGAWTGEVYKTILHLRATRDDLFVAVVNTDWGVGIVRRGKPESIIELDLEEIEKMTYEEFNKNKEYYLNLKPKDWFFKYVSY
ncbi:MAG: Methyltransferase family protein [Desulfonauticus sp. 38_4375]|nr:MAG: Methyltransferase family protein [Desulfonauticus sp. 38_4375]